jgi:hypothetical protein
MKDYLSNLPIPTEQKQYAMSFYNKITHLDKLHSIATNIVHSYVRTGYGNVNSKICFVFRNKEIYDIIYKEISSILDRFQINIWDIYITFVDKTKNDYKEKFYYLVSELHTINPNLVYVFDIDDNYYNTIQNYYKIQNITLPDKMFFANMQKIQLTDEKIRQELWNIFKYLINYKELKKEE